MAIDSNALKDAFAKLLQACGEDNQQSIDDSAARAADLWQSVLLAGSDSDPQSLLSEAMENRGSGPVRLGPLKTTMVCPHHLTIATGETDLIYQPGPKLFSLGTLSALVRACTQRFVLQEEASTNIANALVDAGGALGAAVRIRAEHPCHNLLQQGGENAVMETWASAGDEGESLLSLL